MLKKHTKNDASPTLANPNANFSSERRLSVLPSVNPNCNSCESFSFYCTSEKPSVMLVFIGLHCHQMEEVITEFAASTSK